VSAERLRPLLFALAAVTLARGAAGQGVGNWDLGTLESGKVYRTYIGVTNRSCDGKQDLRLDLYGSAITLLGLPADASAVVRGVDKGETRKVPARVYLDKAKPRSYDDGYLTIRCTTCPAICDLTESRVDIHLTVIAETPSGSGPDGGEPPPERGTGTPPSSPPPQGSENPPPRCGPDLTVSFREMIVALLGKIDDLPASERGAAAGGEFMERNAPRKFDVAEKPGCPTVKRCLGSVQLWGKCVPASAIGAIVDGILAQRLGVNGRSREASTSELEMVEGAAGRLDRIGAFWLGYELSAGIGSPLDVRDEGTRKEVEGLSRRVFTPPGPTEEVSHQFSKRAFWTLFEGCLPCDAFGEFEQSWANERWKLKSGETTAP